jgi:hypothetical protein
MIADGEKIRERQNALCEVIHTLRGDRQKGVTQGEQAEEQLQQKGDWLAGDIKLAAPFESRCNGEDGSFIELDGLLFSWMARLQLLSV